MERWSPSTRPGPRLAVTEDNVFTRLSDARSAISGSSLRSSIAGSPSGATTSGFASALVDARMMAWLLRPRRRLRVRGRRRPSAAGRGARPPTGFVHLLGTTKGFRVRIPDVVRSLDPNG
jgi:hypothetical protein